MVADTLTEIENWFKEPATGQERPKLLAKLALIEFCGWLEEWMDDFIRDVNMVTLADEVWVEANVINSTFGFHYTKHLRPMLCSVLGEHKFRILENKYEEVHPGDLDSLRSTLGDLWKLRCALAHSDLAAHQRAQITVNAPSWTKNQYRLLSKRLNEFKSYVLNNI
ncbi:MAG: hypothetical protein NXH74_14605 [Rhodobacteraceae bacterium]|nr:hypothetical protein [Paracoccaceae bacterium]